MADIKAKDIAVAQSIASSDLILGSSINETTANIRVDTLGNFLINNLPIANLGNASVSSNISQIKNSIRNILTKHSINYKRQCSAAGEFKYMDISFTVPDNHIYIIEAQSIWNYTRCDGIGLSATNADFQPIVFNEKINIRNSGTCIAYGPQTLFVWSKRAFVAQGVDDYWINYVDLGEINSI